MTYSLWQSDDSRYSLGSRMGAQRSPDDFAPEHDTEAPARADQAEMDQIDLLMRKLAAEIDARKV